MRPAGLLIVPFLCLLSALTCGCNGGERFARNLAKSNTDFVADTHLREMNRQMETLLFKLYKRNPRELQRVPGKTAEQRREEIFAAPGRLIFSELGNRQGTDALELAFDVNYTGDRVFAVMVGLVGVVRSSYNWQEEQFIFDSLDAKAFFESARNLEILAWRLSNRRDAQNQPLILTNSRPGEEENLSFERLFGKMISVQDMMAFIIAGKVDRGITWAVQSALSSAVFYPMGI